MNFFISGKVENFRKKKTGKWAIFTQYLLQLSLFVVLNILHLLENIINNCTAKLSIIFFTKNCEIQKIEMDPHLSFLKRNASCSYTKTCRYCGTCCFDPEIINQNLKVTPDCSISANKTAHNINKHITYWITVTNGHINHIAALCTHFHLLQKCSMAIPNMSLVTMKNNSLTVQINKQKKTSTLEQYLPLIEGFRIFFRRGRNMNGWNNILILTIYWVTFFHLLV